MTTIEQRGAERGVALPGPIVVPPVVALPFQFEAEVELARYTGPPAA